jgi:hypothetical protein
MLAWVRFGANGISVALYGPEESYVALGAHAELAPLRALATIQMTTPDTAQTTRTNFDGVLLTIGGAPVRISPCFSPIVSLLRSRIEPDFAAERSNTPERGVSPSLAALPVGSPPGSTRTACRSGDAMLLCDLAAEAGDITLGERGTFGAEARGDVVGHRSNLFVGVGAAEGGH